MKGFRFERLEDIVKYVKVGFVGPINEFYRDSDVINTVPIIRTTDIDDFDLKQLKYVTQEFHKKNKKSQLLKGDLIIARHGSNGNAMIYELEEEAQVLNAVIIRPNQDIISSKLLKIYFDSPFIKDQIKGSVKGSVQGVINTKHVADLMIPISESINYNNVTKIVSDIDAKIEVNNKINQELEAMAKTLYDYWFVQFDFPDANGKPYKSSGGKMVYNEELKREIPEGWEAGVLSDIADITMGQSPAGSSYNEQGMGTVFYQGSTDFGARFPTVRKYTTEPSRMAKENDILLSVRAPVGTLNQAMENCCIGRGLAALREKEGSNSFLWSQMEYFKQIFDRSNALGTTFGSITKDELFGLKLCIPNKEILELFKKTADPFHNQIIVNSIQNQKLAELRDWLLPMLMNGQVRVGELKEDLEIENETELELAAEPPSPYGNEALLSDLFPSKYLYAEVACMLVIEKEMHGKSRGKTWIQKTANHLKEIKKEPKLKDVIFEEYPWGMFSQTIASAIDSNPFLTIDDVAGVSVYKVRFNKIAELNQWMQELHNAHFLASARDIVSLYDDPLINNDLGRIELLNTVYRCIQKLGTTSFEPIYQAMREWRMQEQGFANKAEKFKPYETKLMIGLVEKLAIK